MKTKATGRNGFGPVAFKSAYQDLSPSIVDRLKVRLKGTQHIFEVEGFLD